MNLLEQSADVRDQRCDEASQKLLARGEMHLPRLRPLPSLVTWSRLSDQFGGTEPHFLQNAVGSNVSLILCWFASVKCRLKHPRALGATSILQRQVVSRQPPVFPSCSYRLDRGCHAPATCPLATVQGAWGAPSLMWITHVSYFSGGH